MLYFSIWLTELIISVKSSLISISKYFSSSNITSTDSITIRPLPNKSIYIFSNYSSFNVSYSSGSINGITSKYSFLNFLKLSSFSLHFSINLYFKVLSVILLKSYLIIKTVVSSILNYLLTSEFFKPFLSNIGNIIAKPPHLINY